MEPICKSLSHDILIKVEIDKPGEYSFGWSLSNLHYLKEHFSVNFTIMMAPRAKLGIPTKAEVAEEANYSFIGE